MALLPGWVPYAQGGIAFTVAFVLQAVATAAAVRVSSGPLRALPADVHWSERARALWPVRSAVGLSQVVGAVLPLGILASGGVAGAPLSLALGCAGWLGGAAVGARSARRWAGIPRRGPVTALRGMLATLLGVYGHVLGWGILGVLMPSAFDRRALGFGIAFSLFAAFCGALGTVLSRKAMSSGTNW
jgi:hypothetical protein